MSHPSDDGVKVSVVIDTYNCGHLVRRAVDSVLQQTYPRSLLEIIVVDDGSTDATQRVLADYAPHVRYLWKSNGGQASAINEGVRQANGSIICLLDGDDYFYPEKVQSVVDVFKRHPAAGIVYNRYDVVLNDGSFLRRACPQAVWTGDLEDRTLLGYSWGCVTSALSIRKSVMDTLDMPEEPFRVSADYFLANIIPLVADVGLADQTLSAWVSHGANALLSNPQGSSPEINRGHRAAIFNYAEQRLGKHFLTYLGRAGLGEGLEPDLNPWSRLVLYGRESAQILTANVDFSLKIRAQVKLTASLLPSKYFTRLKAFSTSAGVQSADEERP